MKRGVNRIKVLIICALFLFVSLSFLFSINLISAETASSLTGISEKSESFVSSLFNFQDKENLELTITKWVLMIVFMVLIGLALDFAKFPHQKIFRALIAIPVGFLITAYLVPEEMFIVLPSDFIKFYAFLSTTKLFGVLDMRIVALVGLFIILIMWTQVSKQVKKAKEEAAKVIAEEGIKMTEQIDKASK